MRVALPSFRMRSSFSAIALSSLILTSPVLSQTSTATWQFPLQDNLTINYIDTVVLQWTSNFNIAWMNLWCQNGTPGNNVVLGSQFQVQPSGAFPYIMFTEDPTQANFPVACHAELVPDEPNGSGGFDDPVGVTFTSNQKAVAKTFSSTISSTSSSSTSTTSSSSSTSSSSVSSTSRLLSTSSSLVSSSSSIPTFSSSSSPLPTTGSNHGLSGGAKTGIGIAAALVALAVLAGISFRFWRRRKGSQTHPAWELDNKEAPGAVRFGRHELEDKENRLHELSGTTEAHELHEEEALYELPANDMENDWPTKVAPSPKTGFI